MPAAIAVSDWIQIGALVVLAITLLVIWRQLLVQNRQVACQLLRDRCDAYRSIHETPMDEEVKAFKAYPQLYVADQEAAQRYCADEQAMRRYILFTRIYQYLLYIHLSRRLGIPDPLGPEAQGVEKWVEELVQEREFLEVNSALRSYYPDVAAFVDRVVRRREQPEANQA